MKPDTTQYKPWYKQRWPWLLMIGPAWVIVGGIIMTYLALGAPDALVVDDYYKRGKAINQDLSRDQAAARLQLAFEANYSPARGTLAGGVSQAGKPLASALHVQLVHSTQPEKDLRLELQSGPGGRFSARLPELERARWSVIVEGPGRDWRLTGEWKWPEQRAVTLKAY